MIGDAGAPRREDKPVEFKAKNPKGETLTMVLKLTGKDEGALSTRGVTSDGSEHRSAAGGQDEAGEVAGYARARSFARACT
jgi:hypothetical protein